MAAGRWLRIHQRTESGQRAVALAPFLHHATAGTRKRCLSWRWQRVWRKRGLLMQLKRHRTRHTYARVWSILWSPTFFFDRNAGDLARANDFYVALAIQQYEMGPSD